MSKHKKIKWSKIKKSIESLFVSGLKVKLNGTIYRDFPSSSEPGSGRFWVTLNKIIILDIPKDIPDIEKCPYGPFLPESIGVIREYINTPVSKQTKMPLDIPVDFGGHKEVYLRKQFIHNSLLEVLQMSDRRIGKKAKEQLLETRTTDAPLKIWEEMNK